MWRGGCWRSPWRRLQSRALKNLGWHALALLTGLCALLAGGLPLSPIAIVALCAVLYAGLALPRAGWRSSVVIAGGFGVVLVVRLVANASAPPVGVLASYWSGDAASAAQPERSTDFSWLSSATRIDDRLSFKAEDFQVHFFNDAARFNFGPEQQPARDQLPFFVRWDGYLLVPSDGVRRFEVDADGPVGLWLDGTEVIGGGRTVTGGVTLSADVSLGAGLHPLRLEYARPEARVPRLDVRWQRVVGGSLEAIGGGDLRWQANASGGELSRALGMFGLAGVVLLAVFWVGLGLIKVEATSVARALVGAIPQFFLAHGMLLHAPMIGHATILSGLDDWLVYESSARDILLNGWLMDGGQGRAAPFYGQPLYPYVLALAHRLTGEPLFGPLALQFLALGGVVALTVVLARRAFGSWIDGLVAGACLLVLLQLEAEHFKVARQLFTENLYMPLVMASLVVIVGLARRARPPRWPVLVGAGLLLGLTAIARSQFLLFVPFGLLVLALAWRRRAGLAFVPLFAGLVLAIAPVTARNVAVSGQWVLISSSGGASLLEFHRPPPGVVDAAALARDPLYEALHLDTSTRTVVAFLRADPGGYLATLMPLGAHSVGLKGRNDPGIYWPLLLTCVLYVAAFALPRTRRLHVWPIHAFVLSHLVVLMLFEADTYGYRLVMPMYAPMVAVAAQLPLAALRWAFARQRAASRYSAAKEGREKIQFAAAAGSAPTASLRSLPGLGEQLGAPLGFWRRRAIRSGAFAVAGWGLVAILALGWQGKALFDVWPQREAALHGLGGTAMQAVLAADQAHAEAIYVASIDGTPRRFGAGTLTGLRYPWLKWFDPTRSLPLPQAGTTAVYLLTELQGHDLTGDLTRCLGSGEMLAVTSEEVEQRCVTGGTPMGITFDGLARIESLNVPTQAQAGDALEAVILWQPLQAHPAPHQISLQLDDPHSGDGTLWGNGTLEPYPASQWQPIEPVLTRIPISTDATALPQPYRLTLGIGPTKAGAPQATALWQGNRQQRIPVASVALTPGTSARLPADMQAIDGPSSGGIELIATRALPEEAAVGGPLRIAVVWRAVQDQPRATQFSVRLVRTNGEIVQESTLPLLGGRIAPSTLRTGNVVRDEQSFIVSPRVPTETLSLELGLADASFTLGELRMTGRAHAFGEKDAPTLAHFGGAVGLEAATLEPANVKPAENVTVKLRWRAETDIAQAYKVFVHVLDPAGAQVVAQKDAEPRDGRAPTTGWVPGEVIEDEYAISLPGDTKTGDYPVEIGLYEAKTGARLALASGETRLLLESRLHVAP